MASPETLAANPHGMGAAITEAPVVLAPARAEAAPTDGSLGRLLRFAVANVRRRPERFVLSTLGIALAVMAVVLVRTIAAGYAASGSASLQDVLHGDRLWIVGTGGFTYDPELRSILPGGPAPELNLPDGWTARAAIGARTTIAGHEVALFGSETIGSGSAVLGRGAADALDVRAG